MTDNMLIDGDSSADHTLVLAHGAGAPMDSPFMNAIASGLAAAGWRVARFEFPYMAQRRETGRKRPPDREGVLRQSWLEAIDRVSSVCSTPPGSLFIGGKSMGGRIASLVADQAGVAGLVCLGYPFHPPGKSDRLRTEHLQSLRSRALIVQGERDPFGTRDEVQGYSLATSIQLEWMPDGDHSFKPRKRSGYTEEGNWQKAIAAADAWARAAG